MADTETLDKPNASGDTISTDEDSIKTIEEKAKRERELEAEAEKKAEEARLEAEREEQMVQQREEERRVEEEQFEQSRRTKQLIAESKQRQARAHKEQSRPSSLYERKNQILESQMNIIVAGQAAQVMKDIARIEAAKTPSSEASDQRQNRPPELPLNAQTVRSIETPIPAVAPSMKDSPARNISDAAAANLARATDKPDDLMRGSANPDVAAGRLDVNAALIDKPEAPDPAPVVEAVEAKAADQSPGPDQSRNPTPAQPANPQKPSMFKALGDRVGKIKDQVTTVATTAKDRATEMVGKAKEAMSPKAKGQGPTKPTMGLKADQHQGQAQKTPVKPTPEEIQHRQKIAEINRMIAEAKQRVEHHRANEARYRAEALTHQKEAMLLSAMLRASNTPQGKEAITAKATEIKQTQEQARSQQPQPQAQQQANQPQRQVQPQRQAASISR